MSARVHSPRSLDEALAVMRDADQPMVPLAGGTDLMVELHTGRTQLRGIVDLWAIDELRGIRDQDGGLRIGALSTCTDLMNNPRIRSGYAILAAAAIEIGAEQIRNRATVGGNLGTASPAADLTPVLFALGATVRLCSHAGTRELPVEDFVTGYRRTARARDELIESVHLPRLPEVTRCAFRKVGTRRAQSISKVVVAARVQLTADTVEELCAAAGSVADRTVALASLGTLRGTAPTAQEIERAARTAATQDCSPIDDVRSTATYRSQVLYRVLVRMLGDLLSAAPRPRPRLRR